MSISEKIHPEFIALKAKEIRDFGIRITNAEGQEAEEMIKELARQLQTSGVAPEITRHLYDHAPTHLETTLDHSYGVYVMSQKRGTGPLFAVQIIISDPNHLQPEPDPDLVDLHAHKMDEITLLVEGRIQSIMEIGNRRIAIETLPLIPNRVPKGISHGVINPGPIDSIGFCIRPRR